MNFIISILAFLAIIWLLEELCKPHYAAKEKKRKQDEAWEVFVTNPVAPRPISNNPLQRPIEPHEWRKNRRF